MQGIVVGTIAAHFPITTCSKAESLSNALKLMVDKNVYSVPVYEGDAQNFIGVLTLDAVAKIIVDLFSSEKQASCVDQLAASVVTQSDVAAVTQAFEALTVADAPIEPREPMSSDTPLDTAARALLVGQARIPVVQEEELIMMLSPMTIIRYLARNPAAAGPNAKQSIKAAGAMTCPPCVIPGNETALVGFARMVENKHSGVGVTDEEGSQKVVTIMSLKDLSLALSDLNKLLMSTEDYIKHVRQQRVDTTIYPTINVDQGSSLSQAISKFDAVNTHRMFVRDPDTGKYIGVISLSDVLSALYSQD